MAGAADVYLKQAGTGAAWMGPQSSFDPVQFAKEGAILKRQQAAKKKAEEDAALKGIFPTKYNSVLENDALGLRRLYSDHVFKKATDIIKAAQATGTGLTNVDMFQIGKLGAHFKQLDETLARQAKEFDEYEKLIYDGKAKGYDQEQMYKRRALYYDPTQFEDDEEYGDFVKETYGEILENVKNNPFYKDNPDLAKEIARIEWRSAYKTEILQPILEPISLYKNFKENVKPMLSEFKDAKSITLSNGQVVTTENLLQLQDDIEATVTLADGRKIKTTIPGIKTLAGANFDTDKTVQYSANIYFNKLDDDTKQQYIDNYGNQAVREWYKDEMANVNVSVKGNVKVNKSPTNYKLGGQKVAGNLSIAIEDKEINLNRGGQTYNEETGEYFLVKDYGTTKVKGYTIGKDQKTDKEPLFQFNSKEIYDQNNVPWDANKSQYAENFDIKVTGIYRMPTITKDIDLSKYPDLQKWIKERYKKAASKIKPDEGSAIIKAGTPLTDEEVKKIVEYSELPGNEELKGILGTEIYVSGDVSGKRFSKTKEGYEDFSVQGALVPYKNVKGQWEKQTDYYDWEAAFNADFGAPPNYYEMYRTRPKSSATSLLVNRKKVTGIKKAGEF